MWGETPDGVNTAPEYSSMGDIMAVIDSFG